jgi:hypothetical protein
VSQTLRSMDGRAILTDAVVRAAGRLEAGFGAEIRRPEERMRRAIVTELEASGQVSEVRLEWRPEMRWWPRAGTSWLGGFDLAMTYCEGRGFSTVVECKWCSRTGIDALDEVLWDCFKLAHAASTLDEVKWGLLLYAAPASAWARPARFTTLFDASMPSTRELIGDNEGVWRWLLRNSAKSRPKKLPPHVQTSPVAQVPFVFDRNWMEVRIASVCANGDPWYGLDKDGWPLPPSGTVTLDWPHPEPGLNMEPDCGAEFRWPSPSPPHLASANLTSADMPGASASWAEISWFAAQHEGYASRDFDELAALANSSANHFASHDQIKPDLTLDDLRACLFFEHRRFRHFGHAPDAESTPYIRALIEAIRTAVTALGEREWPEDLEDPLSPIHPGAPTRLMCEICGADVEPVVTKPKRGTAEWWDDPSPFISCRHGHFVARMTAAEDLFYRWP